LAAPLILRLHHVVNRGLLLRDPQFSGSFTLKLIARRSSLPWASSRSHIGSNYLTKGAESMDTNVVLAILKLAAIMLSGILGVVGLLVSYKDQDGKVTKWGRRALIAVVISSLVAALRQGVEVYKQRSEARQAMREGRKRIIEIIRC
jgi:hypothetical protein